jgi:hypothetical protein
MIIRHPVEKGYTVIANATLGDSRLSWKARGLLVYLLSKPDAWEVMVAHLIKEAPDGRDAVLSGLRELEKAGYIVRKGQGRKDGGHFDKATTEVHDRPVKAQVAPQTGLPLTGEPLTGEPLTDNPQRVSTYSAITEIATTEGVSPAPSSPRTLIEQHAQRLAVLAFEQPVKPVLRGGANAFPAVRAIFIRLMDNGQSVQAIERAIRAGVEVWTVAGLQTAIAQANPKLRPRPHRDGDERSLTELYQAAYAADERNQA